MDSNTKAAATAAALREVAKDLRTDGNTLLADNIEMTVKTMPVGQLAKLHDLIANNETRTDALRSLGVEA